MLDEQPIGRHVIAGDDHTSAGYVQVPAHAIAVVGPPGPDVVHDHVIAMHH